MYAQRRDRRQRDRDQRRAAANRRIGHDMAYWYEGARIGGPVVTLLAVAGGVAWVWFNVDHRRISLVLFGLGVFCAVVYAAWFAMSGNTHARMMRAARGQTHMLSMWWHCIALAAVMLVAAGYLIYQP